MKPTGRLHSSRKRARHEDLSPFPDSKKRRIDDALLVNHQTEKIHKKVTVTIGCERFKFFCTYLGHLVKGVMPNKEINTNIREEVTVGDFTVKLRVGCHTKQSLGPGVMGNAAPNLTNHMGAGPLPVVANGGLGGPNAGPRGHNPPNAGPNPAGPSSRASGGGAGMGTIHEHWVCVWVEVIADEPDGHSVGMLRGDTLNDSSPFWQYDLTVANVLPSQANTRMYSNAPSSTTKSQVLKRFTSKHQIVNNGEWGWSTAISLSSLYRYKGNIAFEFDITIFKPRQSAVDSTPPSSRTVAEPMSSILSRMLESRVGADMKILCRRQPKRPLHASFFGGVSHDDCSRRRHSQNYRDPSFMQSESRHMPDHSSGDDIRRSPDSTDSLEESGGDASEQAESASTGFDAMDEDVDEIVCHKGVLCAASDVFNKMFQSPFMESRDNKIEIKDFDPQITRLMIEYLYLGDRALPSNDMAVDWCSLFGISEKYGIESLAQKSVEKMVSIARMLTPMEVQLGRVARPSLNRDMSFRQPNYRMHDFGLDDEEDDDSECEVLSDNRDQMISKCNVLFSLLSIVAQFCHMRWLDEMEGAILSVIQPHLHELLNSNDVRFGRLPHDALIKLLRWKG